MDAASAVRSGGSLGMEEYYGDLLASMEEVDYDGTASSLSMMVSSNNGPHL